MNGFMKNYFRNNGQVMGWGLLLLVAFWIIMLIILPQLAMLDYSFHPNLNPADIGGPKDQYTLVNYKFFIFGSEGDIDGYNKTHLLVFMRTLIAAGVITLIVLALCYPIAYYLGQSSGGGFVRVLALCLIIPYWINEILRAFAFKIIFGHTGLINEAMILFGIWDIPFDFINANVALYSGLVYAYILLMIFPMYNVIESLDRNQIEAARDMGASWFMIHKRVVIPYAKPGIASGCTMVFMLTAGALAAPQILGGKSSLWFTQIIYQYFNQSGGNWSQGSAYAVVLLCVTIVIVLSVMRLFKVNMGDIGK